MKKLLTNNIIKNVRSQRLPKSSINHLAEASQEGFQALLEALNCDPDEITILKGALVDGSADPDFTVTAGWAAYAGEIYQVDAAAFTAGGGETAVWVIETTYPASDPVKFSDGNEFNVNAIRKLKLEAGVSGTGEKDWDEVVGSLKSIRGSFVPDTIDFNIASAESLTSGSVDLYKTSGLIILDVNLIINMVVGTASDGSGVSFIQMGDDFKEFMAKYLINRDAMSPKPGQLSIEEDLIYIADARLNVNLADVTAGLLSIKVGAGVPTKAASDYTIRGQVLIPIY